MLNTVVGKRAQPQKDYSMVRNSGWSTSNSMVLDRESSPYDHNTKFYSMIRKTIPLCDVAIIKKLQLIGNVRLDAHGNKALQEVFDNLEKKIAVNYFEHGINEFVRQLTDAALEAGTGFGEMLPETNLSGIRKLKNAPTEKIKYVKPKNKKDEIIIGYHDESTFKIIPFKNQDFVFNVAFDRRQGSPVGHSMFHSLPFVVNTFQKILNALKNQVWRMGDPSFVFAMEGVGSSATDYATAKKYMRSLEKSVIEMNKKKRMGQVADVFGVSPGSGRFLIQAIGSDVQFIPIEIPVKVILEQIIAKTNFPPFFFGIHWASTYNITRYQSEMIISDVKDMRNTLDIVIDKLLFMETTMRGFSGSQYSWSWGEVNLMDLVEQARARQINALAAEKEIANLLTLVGIGWQDAQEAIDILIENGIIKKKDVEKMGTEKTLEILEQRYLTKIATDRYKELKH